MNVTLPTIKAAGTPVAQNHANHDSGRHAHTHHHAANEPHDHGTGASPRATIVAPVTLLALSGLHRLALTLPIIAALWLLAAWAMLP
jgi:hypothetical protein